MTTWPGFTADYHDPVYNFFFLCHMTQKSIFWVEKLWKIDYFLTLKNYTAIIYPSGVHLWLHIIQVVCLELICTDLMSQKIFTTFNWPFE